MKLVGPTTAGSISGPFGSRERQVIWVLWWTYGAFYFCRTNLSAAVSGIQAAPDVGGLGISKEQIGLILGSLKISYGLGQALNGQLAERFSPRTLLAVGLLGSAALNVLFGLSTGFYFLLFIWAMNGYCQSLGWTPCMRVAANWFPILQRGRAIGLIGTGYQVTQGLTYVVAGWAAETFGWRGAVFVPAGLLILTALIMLLFLEEVPDDGPRATNVSNQAGVVPGDAPGDAPDWVESILLTLTNPSLWLVGLALGLLNACRYGFLDWGLTHLMEVQSIGVGKAGLNYAVLPLGAVAGSYYSGWATDRFFGGRRAPVVCILCILLAILTLAYDMLARSSAYGVLGLLVVIGFCIYGPQVLLVGTAPADLARRGTSAAAAGFVNFLGYMGAASGDVITPRILKQHGWQVAIYVWAGWALAAAVATALLWNAVPGRTVERETKS